MSDLPVPVIDYLSSEMLEQRSPAYIQIDLQGRVIGWGGELERYGITDLQQGDFAATRIAFLQDLLPAPEKPFLMSNLSTTSGASADVHIFSSRESDYVLLLDATDQISRQVEMQQKAHEFSLFQEKQKKMEALAPSQSASREDTANLLDILLEGLGIVALEYLDQETFRTCGVIPQWFSLLYPEVTLHSNSIRFENRFPFLQNFLIDAREFWSSHSSGRIRSGPWIETDYLGKEWDLEASALCRGNRRILVIESSREEFEEKQALIQKGREKALRQRSISRRQKELEKLAERYEGLLSAVRDWALVFDSSGLCLDSTRESEETVDETIQGKEISAFLPKPVADQFLKCITKAIQSGERQSLGYQWETGGQSRFYHARFAPAGKDEVVCLVREVQQQPGLESE